MGLTAELVPGKAVNLADPVSQHLGSFMFIVAGYPFHGPHYVLTLLS
jgi:hypothetical protein